MTPPLAGWDNFYVIVGGSAGALIGLQFVAMALVADLPVNPAIAQTNDAFSTPTIVHFGAVLLVSALMNAPWHGAAAPLMLCGAAGVAGLVYAIVVLQRLRAQSAYKPVFEDWLCHVLLPVAAYAVLVAAGVAGRFRRESAFFAVAGAVLLLLFIGIHNAWDTATYIVFVRRREEHEHRRQRRR